MAACRRQGPSKEILGPCEMADDVNGDDGEHDQQRDRQAAVHRRKRGTGSEKRVHAPAARSWATNSHDK